MCGRFTLHSSGEVVAEAFDLREVPQLQLQFNITPSQPVAVVRFDTGEGRRELVFLRWGLIPAWADDPSIGNKLANARSETVATKPSFRQAFRSRRLRPAHPRCPNGGHAPSLVPRPAA
jgi:putative SOS response-associated peptidase YedK